MNIKGFYVASLQSALDLDVATPDDILVHAPPEVLADHLPRPLWARLLTACLGAPRVDAQLVVETTGVPNLCEHVPTNLMWNCIASIAQRSLGGEAVAPAPYVRETVEPTSTSSSMSSSASLASSFPSIHSETRAPLSTPPPPEEIVVTPAPDRLGAVGPSIPAPGQPTEKSLADIVAELDSDDKIPSAPSRTRQPTSQRFRANGGTGIGRLASARRPQASATSVATERTRRSTADGEYEIETDAGSGTQAREDWKSNLAVEDEQLVDWSASDETVTAGDDTFGGRKR